MVTGGEEAAFSGVYKMAARDDGNGNMTPVMKFSDNPEKTTNPGVKQVWRVKDPSGQALADVMSLEGGDILEKGKRYAFWHPQADYRHFYHEITGSAEALLKLRLDKGSLVAELPPLKDIRARAAAELDSLDPSYRRLLNPHGYKVSITEKLRELKLALIQTYIGDL
jgi:nicotinate phosphoribosyltransferase